MAFILAFNRICPTSSAASSRVWETRDNLQAMEMEGETVLVVGLGGTGLAVARRARRSTCASWP